MELRPYQQEARDAIHAEWAEGHRRTLLVLPTGTGKTIVFAKVVEDRVRQGDRTLILAHRGELLEQAADKIYRATGLKCAVEKAQERALGSPYRVTVGSVQTLMRQARLNEIPRDYYQTIVVDEAHHAISNSYMRILDHFEDAKVLGVTATPDRGDLKDLGTLFDSLAYEYSLRDAIKDEYLSPIRALTIPLSIDLAGVRTSVGDFRVDDIGHALDPYLEAIADNIIEYASDRKIVIFLPLIATSQKMTNILQRKGVDAIEVNGESPNRDQILKDFADDRFNVLCNSMLLTEGWDCPSVDCIVVLRPTKIRSLYAQMVGRGTRLCPGKDHLLILDFLWHTEEHSLCKPASLIAKTQEIGQKMTEMIESGEESLDLEQAMEAAESAIIEEREQSLASRLDKLRTRKKKLVDPLQFTFSIAAEDLSDYEPTFKWEYDSPTSKQMQTLENMGVNPEGVETKGMANKLIARIISRREAGLATPKQIRALERYGFRHVGTWSFEQAHHVIGMIAENGWRVPRWINPKSYQPMPGGSDGLY